MSVPAVGENLQLPPAIAEGVGQAVEGTLASICGAAPQRLADDAAGVPTADLIGLITFLGDVSWSFSLLLPEATAVSLIKTFVGMEIPIDSPDMGDAVGELVNVIAGDIVAKLDARRVKAKMSLPLVARGPDVKVYASTAAPAVRLAYRAAQGPFWVKLTAEVAGAMLTKRPGP
jgi:CheY-specific phosphatase CheX